jgi:hypothetical protein
VKDSCFQPTLSFTQGIYPELPWLRPLYNRRNRDDGVAQVVEHLTSKSPLVQIPVPPYIYKMGGISEKQRAYLVLLGLVIHHCRKHMSFRFTIHQSSVSHHNFISSAGLIVYLVESTSSWISLSIASTSSIHFLPAIYIPFQEFLETWIPWNFKEAVSADICSIAIYRKWITMEI